MYKMSHLPILEIKKKKAHSQSKLRVITVEKSYKSYAVYRSPGPMSKITSDLRVRGRGYISKIRVRGVARVRGDSSKSSGSDS